jgi:tRNA (cmo5U34)-methyltransferase
MGDFEKSAWANEEFSKNYLEKADIYIVDRRRMLEIMSSFFNYFCYGRENVRVLDLGCGDGVLTQELLMIDKTIIPTLVDGSQSMLRKARERFGELPNFSFIEASFQQILGEAVKLDEYDFIVSSFAIHHLALREKEALFKYIHSHLSAQGHFVNLDAILPPSEALEGWYFVRWKQYMGQLIERFVITDEVPEDIIKRYKSTSSMNQPDTLEAQLQALKQVGFKDVDCYYKNGIVAVFGGRK